MWRPHVDPPFGGRDAGHGGGGRVPLVVDRFVVCRRLGRGWPRATGRWSRDPMPPQQGVLGPTREQGRPRRNILPTILHPDKDIEICFSRR